MLALRLAVACLMTVVFGSCACVNPGVKSLVIDTAQNEYVLDPNGNINLQTIEVRTVGSYGQFIPTAAESVEISASSLGSIGLQSVGPTSGTTVAGTMSFDLRAVSTSSGRYLLEFNLCGGMRFDYLILVFFRNDSTNIAWANDVGTTTTDYSFVVTKPVLGMIRSDGTFTDVTISGIWELEVNDTRISIFNNRVAASANARANVSFSQLVIDTNGFQGVTFELRLKSAGSHTSTNTSVTFPPPIILTVASCTHDSTIVPRDNRSSISQFILPAASTTIPLKGWGFIKEWSEFPSGLCRYGGTEYRMVHVDVCNVDCILSGPAEPNSGMLLEYSLNGGLGWERIGMVRVASIGTPMLVPSERVLMRFRDEVVAASVTFVVEDGRGNWLQGFAPNGDLRCYTESTYAQNAQIFKPFYNTRSGFYEVPRWNQSLVRGKATVDFVLGNMLEAGNYTYCCSASTVSVGVSCITILIVDECPSPPEILSVSTNNCSAVTAQTFSGCSAQSSTIITVTGINFGFEGSMIYVGSTPCASTVHDPNDRTRKLRGYNCPGKGTGNIIRVEVIETGLRVNATATYSFEGIPTVGNVSGCPYDFPPSTAACSESSQTITIQGSFFGTALGSVRLYYYDPPGSIPYLEPTVISYSDTKIIANMANGAGKRLEVAVVTASGEMHRARDVTLSYLASRYYTCPRYGGRQCNFKGVCNVLYGVCVCSSDAVGGYWTSATCSECQDGYFGPQCTSKCPLSAGGVVCSGLTRGACDEGPAGTGKCICKAGYGGLACDEKCPGGVASPCGGHGVCTQQISPPVCACHQDATNGFWSGANCSLCDGLHTGATCIQSCPGTTIACNGRGRCTQTQTGSSCTCDFGFCGNACEFASCLTCDPGYFGSTCTEVCPSTTFSGTLAYPCSGHGTCSEGQVGTGACMCEEGYFGMDCSSRCPSSSPTLPCSGNGHCNVITGQCRCNATWSGSDCTVTCPSSNGRMCNDNGLCDDGVSGTGACECFGGYTCAACTDECPGGVLNPCSNHGTCRPDGTCLCYANTTFGHWASDDCSVCDTGYFGQLCNGTCAQVGGVMCAGHGECSLELKCLCQASTLDGFWAQPDCQFCKAGYFGSRCEKECPGGACNTCSQRGTCSDGVNGTGLCTCYNNATAGFFLGSQCDTCAPGYFGRKCNQLCPTVASVECSGRGTCDSGVSGTGLCKCNMTDATGYWGGSCDECASGYAGASCKLVCYKDVNGSICSGHGSCNDGLAGDATCACTAGYAAPNCGETCPRDGSSIVCYGHGTCTNGQCTCYTDGTNGYWAPDACSDCQASYYGATCKLQCPMSGGLVCAGKGTCSEGVSGTGACTCSFGWSGSDCSTPCTGGSDNPCSGHGTCNPVDGTCTCSQSASLGYWAGAACSSCSPEFESSNCKAACPISNGNVCDNQGSCYDGICSCNSGYCGSDCALSGGSCSSQCASGTFGVSCAGTCPGGAATPCSGNGLCSDGTTGTGSCSCYVGYWGSTCSSICPLGPGAGTCSGRGSCDRATGLCQCETGFGGTSCQLICPGGAGNVCSGHGVCNTSTATCTCAGGYVTANCSTECPGGASNPCAGHGQCSSSTGGCTCNQSPTGGYWTGTGCTSCSPGYSGASCLNVCDRGTTSGTQCVCQDKWSNTNCSSECPKTAAGYCNGKGTCFTDSTSNARCECFTASYGLFCNVTCGSSTCTAAPYSLRNYMCNALGQCVCQDNAGGHFTDPASSCTKCKDMYWGDYCDKECPCLGRGTCDSSTGACTCLDSDSAGHFAGSSCERCKEGYIGHDCKSKNILITRQRPCSTIVTSNASSSFLLVDTDNDLLISGGRPLMLCRLSTRLFLGLRDVGGTVIAGSITSSSRISLVVRSDQTTDDTVVEVERNARPTLAILSSGAVYNPASGGATVMGGSRLMHTMAAYTPLTVSIVQRIQVDDVRSVNVYSNGRIALFNLLTLQEAFDFSARITLVQSAAIVNDTSTPLALLIGGQKDGSWMMLSVDLPLSSTSVVKDDFVTLLPVADATMCPIESACISVANILVDGSCPVLTILTTTGVAIAKFCLSDITIAKSSRLLDGYSPSSIFNVTAAVLDKYGNAAFIAINYATSTLTEPTTVYKVSLDTLGSYGSVRFQQLGTINEIVTALQPNNATRALFATVPMSFQVSIVPLNMYAVTRVFPELADTQGGMTLTVQGEGFASNSVLQCDFNGTTSDATFISVAEVQCVVPAGSSELCEGVPVEVTVSSNQFTKNTLPLRRVPTPRLSQVYNSAYITSTDNAYGSIVGGGTVIVNGFGFQDTMYLGCRFTGLNGTFYSKVADITYIYTNGLNGTRFDNASYVNVSMVTCIQPEIGMDASGSMTVEVTLDGYVYTSAGLVYEVVAPSVGYAAFAGSGSSWAPVKDETYASDDLLKVRSFDIFTVDHNGLRLRVLDATSNMLVLNLSAYTLQVPGSPTENNRRSRSSDCPTSISSLSTPVFIPNGSTSVPTVNGVAHFNGGHFVRPPAGSFVLSFIDSVSGWSYNYGFSVDVGEAHSIHICRQPPSTINNLQPTLTTQPTLYLEDIAGNQLSLKDLAGIRVQATYITESTVTTANDPTDEANRIRYGVPVTVKRYVSYEARVAQARDDLLTFEGIEMAGIYGKSYTINFTGYNLVNATSDPLTVEFCRNNTAAYLAGSSVQMYFAKPGTSECFVCPTGALCDGTPNIVLRDNNLWRPNNNTYRLYSCGYPYSGDSCLAPDGRCKEGYEGVRCSECSPGYSRSELECVKCRTEAEVSLLVLLLLVVALAFVSVLAFASFNSKVSDALPVVIKIAINHLQVSNRIPEVILTPPVFKKLFYAQQQVSELIRFDIVASTCAPLNFTTYDIFLITVFLPIMIMAFFGGVFLVLHIFRTIRGMGPKYHVPVCNHTTPIRRDRVVLLVARFMAKIRLAGAKNLDRPNRDDDRDYYFTAIQLFKATCIIALLLVYPSVLEKSASLWRCEDIVYGEGDDYAIRRVLIQDRSIDCDASTHTRMQYGALSACLVYCIGIPLLLSSLIYSHWSLHGRAHARRLFAFGVGGFNIKQWWWEVVIMARKAAIIMVITFVDSLYVRTYLAMWTMSIALGLHVFAKPFERKNMYYLEGLGIASIVIILNLSLLYQFETFEADTIANDALTYVLFGITVLVWAALAVALLFYLAKRLYHHFTNTQESANEFHTGTDDESNGGNPTEATLRSGPIPVPNNGFFGMMKKASRAPLDNELPDRIVVDPKDLAAKAAETPYERLQRMHDERKRLMDRRSHNKTQEEITEELRDVEQRLMRAQALAEAEEAVMKTSPQMKEIQAKHEATLQKLMMRIRQERGEVVSRVEHFGTARKANLNGNDSDSLASDDSEVERKRRDMEGGIDFDFSDVESSETSSSKRPE